MLNRQNLEATAQRRFVSIPLASKLTGLSRMFFYRLRDEGRVGFYHLEGHKRSMIDLNEFEQLLTKELMVEAGSNA